MARIRVRAHVLALMTGYNDPRERMRCDIRGEEGRDYRVIDVDDEEYPELALERRYIVVEVLGRIAAVCSGRRENRGYRHVVEVVPGHGKIVVRPLMVPEVSPYP